MYANKRVSLTVAGVVLKGCAFTIEVTTNLRALHVHPPRSLEIRPAQKDNAADLCALEIQSVAIATFRSVIEIRVNADEIATDLRTYQGRVPRDLRILQETIMTDFGITCSQRNAFTSFGSVLERSLGTIEIATDLGA